MKTTLIIHQTKAPPRCNARLGLLFLFLCFQELSPLLNAQTPRPLNLRPSLEVGIDVWDVYSNDRPNIYLQSRIHRTFALSTEFGYFGYSLNDGFIHRSESNTLFGLGVRIFPFVGLPEYRPLRKTVNKGFQTIDPRTHSACTLGHVLKGFYSGIVIRNERLTQYTELIDPMPSHFIALESYHLERSIGVNIGYQLLLRSSPGKTKWNKSHGNLWTLSIMPELNFLMGIPIETSDLRGLMSYKLPAYESHPFDHRYYLQFQLKAGIYFQRVKNQ